LERKRAAVEVFPQTFAGKLVDNNGSRSGCIGAKAVTVEHFEAVDFPPLPIFNFTPETNRNSGGAKVEIREVG
jgi:hypothetical protein